MKALFERGSHFIHCRRLLGKYIAAVVSSGSGRDEAVLDYLKLCSHINGAQYCGGVSSAVPVSEQKLKEAYQLGSKFISDIKQNKQYPQQIETIERYKQYFKKIMQMRQKDWSEEYQCWLDKGWLD